MKVVEPIRKPPLWEAVLEGLRDAILGGALPAGSTLVEADLAARFGTSRGPIREALRDAERPGSADEVARQLVAELEAEWLPKGSRT
jgi:DNA-binding GntR family transcriptional regulator